jgi:hypothetical protein
LGYPAEYVMTIPIDTISNKGIKFRFMGKGKPITDISYREDLIGNLEKEIKLSSERISEEVLTKLKSYGFTVYVEKRKEL